MRSFLFAALAIVVFAVTMIGETSDAYAVVCARAPDLESILPNHRPKLPSIVQAPSRLEIQTKLFAAARRPFFESAFEKHRRPRPV
jgi:hypothetical protein